MGCHTMMLFFVLIACTSILGSVKVAASSIGSDYDLLGDDLPPPSDYISLYKSIGINKIRIFDPNTTVLKALRGHLDIGVIIGVKNQDLAALAASEEAVWDWFATNIRPYLANVNITFITVGKEVIPGDIDPQVLPVMQSLTNLVKFYDLPISISTVLAMENLGESYPPSPGMLTSQARRAQHVPVLNFLSQTNTPILVDTNPYFEYPSTLPDVRLDYATNYHTNVVVEDGHLRYSNLLDEIFDDFVWAMAEEGVKDLPVVISETGWSSADNGILTVGIMRVRNLYQGSL